MARIFSHTLYLFLLFAHHSNAQQRYGNEWINPQQTYLKIPVAQTGFYQISAAVLDKAGVPLGDIASSAFQMFRRGRELAIEVTVDKSGKMAPDGYITFYGEKNDGTADSALYTSPENMPHSYYSLYSDTATYFLTWTLNGVPGKRVLSANSQILPDTLTCHTEEDIQLFTSHYLPGAFYPPGSNFETGSLLTAYDKGEGWTGPEIKENQSFELSAQTKNMSPDCPANMNVELLLAGWSQGNHDFEIWTGSIKNPGRKLTEVHFEDYNTIKINVLLNLPDIEKDGKVLLAIVPVGNGGHISVSYFKIRYTQKSTGISKTEPTTYFFDHSENTFWKIKNDGRTGLHDVSDPYHIRKLRSSGSGIWIDGAKKVISSSALFNVTSCQPVQFHNINPSATNYLIITDPAMHNLVQNNDPVLDYAAYRSSTNGGKYNTLILTISEVFDQFNYGDREPLAVRNLIAWMSKTGSLKFVLLIGKSIDPQKARKLANPEQFDKLPNAGWPGSDVALTMETNPALRSGPRVAIGRISAETSQQLYDYLQKVKAMEAEAPAASWRKKILHLSGGRSRDELKLFNNYVRSFEEKLDKSSVGALVTTIAKQTEDLVEKINLFQNINEGVALLTLFGHSGLDVTDIDIGMAGDATSKYQNHPRYPAVIVNGCASGSIFYAAKTLSSDWIFAPKSGAVLFLAHTFNGVSTALKRYTDIFYEVLADSSFTSEPFGTIQREAIKRNMSRNPTMLDIITAQQMTLHGDPAIRIFPAHLPDYTLDSSAVRFSDVAGKALNALSDTVLLKFTVKNNGRYQKENYQFSIKRSTGATVTSELKSERAATPGENYLFLKFPNLPQRSEEDVWEITLDPENVIREENEFNNHLVLRMKDMPAGQDIPVSVPPVLVVTLDKRQLRDYEAVSELPTLGIEIYSINTSQILSDTSGVKIWLQKQCSGCEQKRVYLSNAMYENRSPGHFYLEKILNKLDIGEYHLLVQARDSKGMFAPDYEINFRVNASQTVTNVHISPNPSGDLFKISMDFEGLKKPQDVLFRVYDINGKKQHESVLETHIGKNEWFWNAGKLPAGMYFYFLELNEKSWTVLPEAQKALRGKLIHIN